VQPKEWRNPKELGEWTHTAGKWYGKKTDKGIQTTKDAKFHGLSTVSFEEFSNEGKDLVVQYSVKHEQSIDCGGAYIKLLPPGFDQNAFGGDTPYSIMFGPDICGHSTRKTHVIFNYKGENLLTKNEPRCETDQLTHVYTLVVRPDNTYEVMIDGETEKAGRLEDDWAFLKPKEIKDPEASKPDDWVDERMIPDPEDEKPEGYDDVPEMVPDPDAEKPDDWDDEDDGDWEPPMVDNPDYMGPWSPKMIKNPEYKGEWEHPMVPNPEYEADDSLYHRCNPCGGVGFELWQVKSGTIFDDIIVTDSLEEAKAFMAETHGKKAEKEKDMFEEIQEEERAEAERRRAEAEEARRKAEEDADEEEEEEVVDMDEEDGDVEEDDDTAEIRSEL
jgi:calreticulin